MYSRFALIQKIFPINSVAVELWNSSFGNLTTASEDLDYLKKLLTGLLTAGFSRKKSIFVKTSTILSSFV